MIVRQNSFSTAAVMPHTALAKAVSLPDLRPLLLIANRPPPAALHGFAGERNAGQDLRAKTPSPHTSRLLLDCSELASAPDQRVTLSPAGRLETIPDGSAEHLLRRQHRLDEDQAGMLAAALRRGGFQPRHDHVWTAGDVTHSLQRLSERSCGSALPAIVCAQTEAALQDAMRKTGAAADPWDQFDRDLPRNPYYLNGSRQRDPDAFRAAAAALSDAQRRFVCQAHQGLLAEVEISMFAGTVLHRDGALLRSHDSAVRGGPVPDTRFHVDIPLSSTHRTDVVIRVDHDRPLSAAAPRTAGLDALPEHRVLTEDSALRVRLTATCSPSGAISVRGEHSIHLRYEKDDPQATAHWTPAPLPADGDPDHVRDRLTALLMELHDVATRPGMSAVAQHLLAPGPDDERPGVAGLLDLALALDRLVGGKSLLPADLARFAFDELRQCAEHARATANAALLARLQQTVMPADPETATPAARLPDHGHWPHARQALCRLIATLLYRNLESATALQLDSLSAASGRADRKACVSRLESIADASNWPALRALLPRRRLIFWDTTMTQRPAPCAFRHGSASRYLETALGCLNAIRQAQARARTDGT